MGLLLNPATYLASRPFCWYLQLIDAIKEVSPVILFRDWTQGVIPYKGVGVQQIDLRPTFKKKLAFTALLLFILHYFLPFFLARENRISAEISCGMVTLGLLFTLLLSIPPLLLLLYAFIKNEWVSEILLTLAATLGLLLPFVVLAKVGPNVVANLGPFARYSPASGMYVYITAVAVIYLMKPRLRIYDYLGFIVVIVALIGLRGNYSQLGIFLEAKNFGSRLSREVLAHIRITGISLAISIIIGLPLALFSYQSQRLKKIVFPLLNILQTIPGIALFGLLIAPLAALSLAFPQLRAWGIKGIGNTPAIIALSMYALYPIIRYSFTAFTSLDEDVILSARGMGMNSRQIWFTVRFPLAMPGVLHGIRVALVQTIGNATLAKLIGGDGLGVLVFEGLGQASVDMVLLGMLLIIALTVVADQIFQVLITLFTPIPLRNTEVLHD